MDTQVEATGAEILVDSLIAEGVETVFGLPGLQLDHIFDALYHRQNNVRVIHTRHEQAAAYMAFGYAQASGRVGTCLVVPGPGVLNTTAALSTAYACNAPVLCVTGQVPLPYIESGLGFLHEMSELTPQLVTFNGNSFDLPVLRYRALVNKVAGPACRCAPISIATPMTHSTFATHYRRLTARGGQLCTNCVV